MVAIYIALYSTPYKGNEMQEISMKGEEYFYMKKEKRRKHGVTKKWCRLLDR